MSETTINTQEFDAAREQEAANNTEQDTNGGDLILGKFKSQQDLEKAYTESQKKITELSSGNTTPTGESESQESEEVPEKVDTLELQTGEENEESQDDDSAPLLDIESALAEYTETGEFSEGTVESFEKVGISKQYLDLYKAGIEALGKLSTMEGVALVGGESEYKSMAEWAKTSISPDELKAYDAAVNSTDKFTRDSAILALHSKYVSANGSDKQLIQGGNNLQNGIVPFRSEGEKQVAMADPRYKTNEGGYRDEVLARIMAANAA